MTQTTGTIDLGVSAHLHVEAQGSGWPTNKAAVEAVHEALDQGTVFEMEIRTEGPDNRDQVITLRVRHRDYLGQK